MNPSLEASWRHPWRQDLHTGVAGCGSRGVLEATPETDLRCPNMCAY
ncbi:hypothetical protein [Halorhodospira halochloris]|nr:hypothetical protein [Halorhodospira halochloris]